MLKNNHSEDQWSPLNPEGKKHYDREFLLQFMFNENAMSKPAGLPDIPDIILDKPLTSNRQFSRKSTSSAGSGSFIDFTTNYVWNQGGGQRPINGGQKQRRRGGRKNRHTFQSNSKDIRLHKAEEAWKPTHGKVKDTPDEAAKTEELYKKTRSILNKLTPERLQALVSQMQSLPIDSEAKLEGVVDLVFETAVSGPSSGRVYTNKCGGLSMVAGEPSYSVAYANLCKYLSMFKVPSESKPGEMVNFRAVLLTRCQREFEKDKSSEALFTMKREEIEKAAEDAKKELQAKLEYQTMLAKLRSLGYIRFIGELFKLKMLTKGIMHNCVSKLLCTKDSENLECLWRLLTTIGKEMDTDKAKNYVDEYFQQMSKIVNDKKSPLTSRVKFMLQDIMELKQNKWVPRRVDNNPKTIEEIHKEMELEAQKKALLTQQAKLNKPARRGRGGRGGYQGQHHKHEGAGDLYSGKQRTSLKVDRPDGSCRIKIPNRMPTYATMPTTQQGMYNMPPQQQPITSYPSQGYGNMPIISYNPVMHQPTTIGPAQPAAQKKKNMLKIVDPKTMKDISEEMYNSRQPSQQEIPNRMPTYATMPTTQQGLYNMPPQQQPITSYPSQGYGNMPINFYNPVMHQPTTTAPAQPAAQKKKNMLKIVDPNTMKDISEEIYNSCQPSQQEVTQDSGSRTTPVQSTEQTVDGSILQAPSGAGKFERWWHGSTHSTRPAMLLEDEMKKKTTVILDEYLYIQEALLCVKELSSANHPHFVQHSIKHVLERSNVARKRTGHLLHDIVKQKVISVEAYIKGLVEVLELAEDLERDIPMIWKYYGELISPMIQDSSVPLSFLKQVCQPLMASNKAGCLLAEVLKDASHREGHKKVGELWMSSGLEWSDFVPMCQVEQFLVDNKLEFTKGGDSAPMTPTTGLPLSQITEKLEELIVAQHKDNDTVYDWIESNVDEPTTKKPKFIRALMTAVCKGAIKGEKGKEKVDQKEVAGRHDLLQKYLDHQPDFELQAMYALQALVTKLEHPQGLLRTMFDTLYDDDIISEDVFIQWKKSEEENEGKGAALEQVVLFFKWLKEAEDDN